MATTGFWPVKGRLKDVLDYAENPDKTIDRRYLDDDLAQALRYVENPEKTDQQMYVSAINCRVEDAYSQMQETKRRYGKEGRNVAYHGYQSPTTATRASGPERSHLRNVIRSVWRPRGRCGEIMRWSSRPISTQILCITTSS